MRGVSKYYDADLDYKQKIEEMRGEWELRMQEKYDEKNAGKQLEDDDEFDSNVSTYFEKTSKSPVIQGMRKEHENGNGLNEKEGYNGDRL